jgi:hypothetical protein
MAAPTSPTLATYFINNFRTQPAGAAGGYDPSRPARGTEPVGDAQALETIFNQADVGRPFFYACEDPNTIGFIYTDKRGLTTQKHLYVKSHFTSEVVSVDMLHRLGVPRPVAPTADTLPHLIAANWMRLTPPLCRPSSDPDAISLTFLHPGTGERGDLRLHFFMGDNDCPIQVKAAYLTHVYNSSYDRYYWNPVAAAAADPIP